MIDHRIDKLALKSLIDVIENTAIDKIKPCVSVLTIDKIKPCVSVLTIDKIKPCVSVLTSSTTELHIVEPVLEYPDKLLQMDMGTLRLVYKSSLEMSEKC